MVHGRKHSCEEDRLILTLAQFVIREEEAENIMETNTTFAGDNFAKNTVRMLCWRKTGSAYYRRKGWGGSPRGQDLNGKRSPSSGLGKCKGPEVGNPLVSLRIRNTTMAGAK